jgi:hypothetical protein
VFLYPKPGFGVSIPGRAVFTLVETMVLIEKINNDHLAGVIHLNSTVFWPFSIQMLKTCKKYFKKPFTVSFSLT